jgi:hypothetical protein
MLLRYKQHRDEVARWLAKAGKTLSNEQLVDLFEEALRGLCAAARPSVSEVTLTAVLDRALVNAADARQGLPLHRLVIVSGAADFAALRAAAPGLKRPDLLRLIAFIVTDFLAILGSLTGHMLNDDLHAKLSTVRLGGRRGGPKERKKA